MGEWISIKKRLPEIGDRIWARFSKKNGEPRSANPVREGDYGKSPYKDSYIGFIFGIHRNIAFSADYCPQAGVTHW